MKFIAFSGFLMSAGLVSAAVDYLGTALSANNKCSPFQYAVLMDTSASMNTTCDAMTSMYKALTGSTDLSCVDGAKMNQAGIYLKVECATSVDAFAAKTFPGIKYFGMSMSSKSDCSDPSMVALYAADGSCLRVPPSSGSSGAGGSAKVTANSGGSVTLNNYNSTDCSGTAKTGSGEIPSSMIGQCNSGTKFFLQGSASRFAVNVASIAAVVASVVLVSIF